MMLKACALGLISAVAAVAADCGASDANLLSLQRTICASFAEPCAAGAKADQDWPNQAVYMRQLLSALQDPATCLNTTAAAATVGWLNAQQADPGYSGGFMWTWEVFQVQYYDMPRLPGNRIEAPDTLGRKCWAFAYMAQQSAPVVKAADAAVAAAGLDMSNFTARHAEAIPMTLDLCQKVICNCFVNASYDPSRSGSCHLKVEGNFHTLGFDRENLKRKNVVDYTWHEHC